MEHTHFVKYIADNSNALQISNNMFRVGTLHRYMLLRLLGAHPKVFHKITQNHCFSLGRDAKWVDSKPKFSVFDFGTDYKISLWHKNY